MPPVPTSSFLIKTAVFEGPLELLLDLVEKRKLLINDVALAAVTDEYMRYVSEMQELSLPNTAQFISLAATLLLVKSKSLLPVLELTEEEEVNIEELETRLRKYQIIREAARTLEENFDTHPMYGPQFTPPKEPLFLPDQFCSLEALENAIENVINDLPHEKNTATARVKTVISLEEVISRLKKRIAHNLQTKFSDLCDHKEDKAVIVVSFLAILELFKQGNLIINQNTRFADFDIESNRGQTPIYY